MKEVYWIDIADEQPEKDQQIFYIDTRTAEQVGKWGFCNDDIDKGLYYKDNLVEWHYDMAPEEFKYWYPIPSVKK